MNSISVLETGMINKIAAGEVVERPLSVIKELAENSIDAGATDISVEIKDGGISYIRVADNGRGIPQEQVSTAFLRHATSKIANLDDLESVLTMGFRGEALSSISAVAQVEIITKTAEQAVGRRLEINGGELISESASGTTDGTDIRVRNLFYNVPARRKFLKKPATESGYISDIINKLALGNTNIAFKYVNNNTTILKTNGNGDLKTVIYQIFGREASDSLIELNYEKSGIRIGGYIGKPSVARGNRNYSLIYINKRYVKSEIIQSAAEEAFRTRLMQNKFPLYVMHISIDPRTVDVNVHPTKLEVRFSDEDLIYKSVESAVSSALKTEILIPQHKIAEFIYEAVPLPQARSSAVLLSESEVSEQSKTEVIFDSKALEPSKYPNDKVKPRTIAETRSIAEPPAQIEIESQSNAFFKDCRIVGQFFNTYWLIERESSVYLVDQHAAHERVLYEKLIENLRSKKSDSQSLVQPIVIPVSQSERLLIEENKDFFMNCGFDVQEFDQSSYVLYAVPFILGKPAGAGFFIEILDRLNSIGNIYDAKLDAIASISCKAAVKANDRLSNAEARELLEQLQNPFTCPHGRPVAVELSKTEIEKMFKRVQT